VDSFDILKRLSGNRENKNVPVAISDDKWKDVVKWLHKGSKKLKKKTPKSYEEFERPYVTALIWHTSSRRASNNISSILDESTKDYQKKIANAVWKTRKHLSKLKQLCTDPDRAPPESKHEGGNLTFEALLSRHIERAKFLCMLSNISFSSSNVSIVESDPLFLKPFVVRFDFHACSSQRNVKEEEKKEKIQSKMLMLMFRKDFSRLQVWFETYWKRLARVVLSHERSACVLCCLYYKTQKTPRFFYRF